jgi:chaperonin cofactor prefoldin
MKRQRHDVLEQDSVYSTPTGVAAATQEKEDSLQLHVARFEMQMQEQSAEIAALREMVMSGCSGHLTDDVSTSCNTVDSISKVKMEDEQEAALGDNDTACHASMANDDQQQEEEEQQQPHDDRDFVIADLEQKVQQLEAELAASQEVASRYQMQLEEYKNKMQQLHQLTGL